MMRNNNTPASLSTTLITAIQLLKQSIKIAQPKNIQHKTLIQNWHSMFGNVNVGGR